MLTACGRADDEPFVITARYPHDSTAYTQGLVAAGDLLFESTGLYGHSELRRVDLLSGRVVRAVRLAPDRFGEGLTLLHGRLYQLTWKSGIGYIYDAATLARTDSFRYAGEGWGLTADGTSLIMSDGSDSLRVLDPATLTVRAVLPVRYRGAPVYQVNELEFVGGELFANVYQTDWILRIDPRTGEVRDLLRFANLYPLGRRPAWAGVMNGIAAADSGRLLVTGKNWPVTFEVRLRPSAHPP